MSKHVNHGRYSGGREIIFYAIRNGKIEEVPREEEGFTVYSDEYAFARFWDGEKYQGQVTEIGHMLNDAQLAAVAQYIRRRGFHIHKQVADQNKPKGIGRFFPELRQHAPKSGNKDNKKSLA